MTKIIALAFCLLLGVSFGYEGWKAIIWVPAGFLVGLFGSAQILLPLILGLPRAVRFVANGRIRAAVFLPVLCKPLGFGFLLFAMAFLTGFFFPHFADFMSQIRCFDYALDLGVLAICLSALSRKGRNDFWADFETTFKPYYIQPHSRAVQKQVDAIVKVATNLFLTTAPNVNSLESRADARFRYMIFCFCATIAICKDKFSDAEVVIKGLGVFLFEWAISDEGQKMIGYKADPTDAVKTGSTVFGELMEDWLRCIEMKNQGDYGGTIDLIGSMIHSTESAIPIRRDELQRLEKIARNVDGNLLAMKEAFVAMT